MKKIPRLKNMKPRGNLKFLVLIFTLVFLCWTGIIKAQNITHAEYYFDNDPGFGNGTAVSITPAPHIDNLNVNVSISGLTPGFHHLFFRVKDEFGKWSHTQSSYFLKVTVPQNIPDIVAVEYFFDNDPGYGNATPVQITPATHLSNLSFSADINALSTGFHYLRVRVKDAYGKWSLAQSLVFLKGQAAVPMENIVKAEYFFDQDPGFGQGMNIPLVPDVNLTSLDFTADITNVSNGFHNLYCRVKDGYGKWSLTAVRPFFKESVVVTLPEITQAEYFLDQDPGFGNGTNIAITPGVNLSNIDFVIDITTISSGFHNIYCRVKDAFGKWSLTSARPVYKEEVPLALQEITKVEYFLDQDPGFGNGINVPIVPGVNKTVNWVVNIAAVTPGFHMLYTRVKDSLGLWSLTNARPFYKDFVPVQASKIKKVEYFIDTDPGFGNAHNVTFTQDTTNLALTFDIDITTLSQGFHQLFVRTKDARGKWSLTLARPFFKQIFYDTLPELVQIEYFYDQDPGFGNGIQVPFTPAQQVPFLTWSLNLTNVPFGQHQLFIRTKDAMGKWSLAARDTIFYYLDSLPTASINGPVSMCINGSGEFEVTLTGTPPWTLIYNTGEEIDTVSGIMVTPYTFTVSPTFSGNHTAQVLKVQDTYYTGLYTGIPIEYEVHPLPAAAGNVYGPTDICAGTSTVWYWIYGVANATSYSWSVPPGAAIVSNPYSSSILVDFSNVTGSGIVSVTPNNYCGSGTSASIMVNIREHPVVDAGPDLFIPYGGSDTLSASVSGGTGPYSYYWSPWYYLNNSYSENPIAYPAGTTTFTVQVTDSYGCSGTDQLVIYVGVPEGTIVSGSFNYDNAVNTPMNNSYVMVKQGNTVIATDTTDQAGSFWIPGIPAGYYYMTGTTDKDWGGVNATDALLVLQHYVEYLTLSGLKLTAADVTASYGINAADAFLIAKRYTGLVNTFPSGDWYSESVYFSAAPVGTFNSNLNALCFGDVDGSYIPGAKIANGIEILNEGILSIPSGGVLEVPVTATHNLEAGAISLSLQLPDNLTVTNVRSERGTGNLVFNVIHQQLKIAWYSLNPFNVNDGDVIFWITVSGRNTEDFTWSSADGSTVANGMGQTLNTVTFRMPKVVAENAAFAVSDNYPDPFSFHTTIRFDLPEDGLVTLKVYNSVGQLVETILNGESFSFGNHNVLFEANDLPSGVYYYTLELKSLMNKHSLTKKMVIQK